MTDSRTKTKQISIFRLNADNFTPNPWGGSWLPVWKKANIKKKYPIGESWDFSLHAHFPSRILMDEKWRPLKHFLKASPFLLKFIDACDNLSIQVHPDDSYARRHEKDSGKAESWAVLSTGRRASDGFIYLGFRADLAAQYKSADALKKDFYNTLQHHDSRREFLRFLNKIKVKAGDVFYLPPGTVHAIGAGVRLFEVQQTSNVTYRVWDWDRLPARPLHLKQAFEVIRFKPQSVKDFKSAALSKRSTGEGSFSVRQIIIDQKRRFAVQRIDLKKKNSLLNQPAGKDFCVLTVIEGTVGIPGWGSIPEGHSVVVAAGCKAFQLKAESERAVIFRSFVP